MPTKKRTKATLKKEWKAIFLSSLAESGIVGEACKVSGICRNTAYEHKEKDPAFAAKWLDAVAQYVEGLEAEADRRAVQGVTEPVGWFQGTAGGHVQKYSDTLLMFRLKALAPAKYRERFEHSGPDGGPIVTKSLKDFYGSDS